jgi:hypothetical protein
MSQPLSSLASHHPIPSATWSGFSAHGVEDNSVHDPVPAPIDIAHPGLEGMRRALARLKQTALYDAGRKLWRESTDRAGALLDDRCVVDTQLTAFLVEAAIDRESAASRYAAIGKRFSGADREGQWAKVLRSDGSLDAPATSAREALLVTLALAVFDRRAARQALDRLLTSNLFDPGRAQWNWHWVRDAGFLETDRCADVQLLGASATRLLGSPPGVTPTTLDALRATPLWNEPAGLWSWFMTAEQVLMTSVRPAATQHLGVIAEALEDRAAARRRLASLAGSALYDPERRLWNHAVTADGDALGGEVFAMDQLLALLAHGVATGKSPW